MEQQSEELFEEGTRGSVGAITVIGFVLSLGFLLCAALLTSYGASWPNPNPAMFVAGAFSGILAFALPFGILPAILQ